VPVEPFTHTPRGMSIGAEALNGRRALQVLSHASLAAAQTGRHGDGAAGPQGLGAAGCSGFDPCSWQKLPGEPWARMLLLQTKPLLGCSARPRHAAGILVPGGLVGEDCRRRRCAHR
jgi:hypothetical protein